MVATAAICQHVSVTSNYIHFGRLNMSSTCCKINQLHLQKTGCHYKTHEFYLCKTKTTIEKRIDSE